MIRNLSLAAMAAAMACASMPTYAADRHNPYVDSFSGAQCQPSNGSQWSDFTINPDGLRNDSATQNRYISCTMLARNILGIDQGDLDPVTPQGAFTFWVSLDYSQVPTETLSYATTCTVFAKNLSNGNGASEAFNVSSTRTLTPVRGTITPTSFNGWSPNAWGTYSFNCRLPPKVKLLGFLQVTWGDTGGYRWVP